MENSIFGQEKDHYFMEQALVEARVAGEKLEVPIGAIVVNAQGDIIARGHNSVEADCTQRSHAESLAIEHAGKYTGDWRLEGCWLYVTLEPCMMCMSLVRLSRLRGVIYGADSPLFGFELDKVEHNSVYKRDAFSIIKGLMADQSAVLLKQFFKKRREER